MSVELVLDGRYPTRHELDRLSAVNGGEIHVLSMPSGEESLAFLAPVSDQIIRLNVTDWACRDARIISELTNLEELSIVTTDPRYDVDFSRLAKLRSYSGRSSRHYASALELEGLSTVGLDGPSDDYLRLVRSEPTDVGLFSARNVTRLPQGENWHRLENFELHGSGSFDVGSLKGAGDLRRIEFDSVKKLVGLSTLADLPRLDELVIENCTAGEEADALASLGDRRVLIIGPKVPVDRDFIARHFGSVPERWEVTMKLDPATRRSTR